MTVSKAEIYGRWAEQLYQNGYDPLPLKGKKGMSGWTTFQCQMMSLNELNI